MANQLWLVPLLPLCGFLILSLGHGLLPRSWAPWIGAGSVGLAALLSAAIGLEFHGTPAFRQTLWQWMTVADLSLGFSLYLDTLSLTMLYVVTGVGFLIHVYSAGYMADDPGYGRFFAYMNLFVFAMLILVLADNFPLLYLGWEGVGLCSYLLIGFWYEKPENGYAARKAFVVTRVGDTAFALGLFLLFTQLGTLDIQQAMEQARDHWPSGSTLATAAALLLLGGAVGKSAQLPLQVWLPDAMAGPTPISALIHAATMVTAGVYLIARTHALFALAPQVQHLVGLIGGITLLLSGCTALTQRDIKRILAYSTISQIGYMFLGLGVGAWSAAIFHLMTHAFFKALLFLAAGAVILSLHHEQDIFKMGGLWKRLPVSFWTFLMGGAALTALPLTSGEASKHEILLAAYSAGPEGLSLWIMGVIGAALTGLYTSRLILIAFFGPAHAHAEERLPWTIVGPLGLLAILSILGGLIPPHLAPALPETLEHETPAWVGLTTTTAPFLGIGAALWFYRDRKAIELRAPFGQDLFRFWQSGWGFDWLYERLLVRPFLWLARINRSDIVDGFYSTVVAAARWAHGWASATQTGRLRWYAATMVFGVVLVVALGAWP